MGGRRLLRWPDEWADWFEKRGVYVPGEDNRVVDPWRDWGWLIVLWLAGLATFILVFAIAV
ncbi:hypothetical protein [Saccharomonospora glauca]|jgi:hypothetical protein|uniref:DUF5808 domain-containing protein n=1 Tax=Saccharomonospora glauca K62 TaxID=928724 RepID=I1D5D2_9PSEU|nr:hypothetical protein [Saccharomonospora glauca]EIF00157.1 hypothetical protein SacglDRAFT_03295 [Saccharomonospora glauca K62]